MISVLRRRRIWNADREEDCKTRVEIAVGHLQAKEDQGLLMTPRGKEEARKDSSLKFWEHSPVHTLALNFQPPVLPNQFPSPDR